VLLLAIVYRVRLMTSFASLVATAPTFVPDHHVLPTPLPHPFISYMSAESLAQEADPTQSRYVPPASVESDNRCIAFFQCLAPFTGYIAGLAVVISPILMLGFAFSDSNPAQDPSARTDYLTMISVAMSLLALYWAWVFHNSQSRRFWLFSSPALLFFASMLLAVATGIVQAASVDSVLGAIASCILSAQCIIQGIVIVRINSQITLQFHYSLARFGMGFLWLYNVSWAIILLFSNWHPSAIESGDTLPATNDWFTFMLRAGGVHYRLFSAAFFFECLNLDASRRVQQYMGCRVVKGATRYQMLREAAKRQTRRNPMGYSNAPDAPVYRNKGGKNPLSYGSADSVSAVTTTSSSKKGGTSTAMTPLLPAEFADAARGSALVARDPSGAFVAPSSLAEVNTSTTRRSQHQQAVSAARGSSLVARDPSLQFQQSSH
jgi:hypothetical protein